MEQSQMQHRRRNKIIFLIVTGLLVALAASWWFIALIADESRAIYPYSPAYWLVVPDSIRRLPLDHCSGPARYYYSAGDGPKSLMITRRCHTSDPTAAIAYYRRLLPKWGYRFSDQEPTYFRQNDHVLKLSTAAPGQFDIIYLW